MKKIIALVLAAMLLFSCAALAETAEKTTVVFDDSLSLAVPPMEGHTMEVINADGLVCFRFVPDDPETGLLFSTVIFPTDDEDYAKVTSLNDLTEEQMQQYINSCIEAEMNDPTWTIAETGKGSKLVLIKEQGTEHDYVYLYSVYNGYQICTYVDHIDGADVTDADIEALLAFHTELDFIETTAAE